jgi:uncharacterized delta-60 repeat protein
MVVRKIAINTTISTQIASSNNMNQSFFQPLNLSIMLQKWTILITFCCFSFLLQSQAGLLDSTFGDFGTTSINMPTANGFSTGGVIVPLPDGKTFVLYSKSSNGVNQQFTVTRLLPDGAIDENFGDLGNVFPDITADDVYITDAILSPDGKIVAVGSIIVNNANSLIILQFEQDGSFDADFGNGGLRIFSIGGEEDLLSSVKIKPDGNIITCGYTVNSTSTFAEGIFIQLHSDGSDDETFGSLGLLRTDFNVGNEGFFGLDIQSDGKIVAAGGFGEDQLDMMVARFLPNGVLDNSFADDGILQIVDLISDDILFDIVVNADQKITVFGNRSDLATEQTQFALFRLETAGTFDATFGDNGKVFKNVAIIISANKLIKQPDGKYLVSGSSIIDFTSEESLLWVYRYNTDGTIDETFGQLGSYTALQLSGFPELTDLVLQQDNKILFASILGNIVHVTRLQADAIIATKSPSLFNANLAISPNPMQ